MSTTTPSPFSPPGETTSGEGREAVCKAAAFCCTRRFITAVPRTSGGESKTLTLEEPGPSDVLLGEFLVFAFELLVWTLYEWRRIRLKVKAAGALKVTTLCLCGSHAVHVQQAMFPPFLSIPPRRPGRSIGGAHSHLLPVAAGLSAGNGLDWILWAQVSERDGAARREDALGDSA